MASINGQKVGPIGYGLMGFTWRPTPVAEEQAFEAMRTALAKGANFWNGGEFYGTPENNSLTLLAKYFKKYPEDASKVILSIKGAADLKDLHPIGTPEGVRKSVENCVRMLDGAKKIDIFECARVDPNVPIEETVGALAELVKEGKIGGIALSEAKAETIRRANKVHPISAVEIELSLWSLEPLSNGVASTCAELNIPLVAYSPIGRGMLTGQIKRPEDIPEGDFRRYLPRFQGEAFNANLQLVSALGEFAKQKGCTPAQLAISWVQAQGGKAGKTPAVIPIPGATTAARVEENCKVVALTDDEFKQISDILAKFEIVGNRYPGENQSFIEQ